MPDKDAFITVSQDEPRSPAVPLLMALAFMALGIGTVAYVLLRLLR